MADHEIEWQVGAERFTRSPDYVPVSGNVIYGHAVPVPPLHAVSPATGKTACKLPGQMRIDGARRWPFGHLKDQCPECRAATGL